MKNSENGHVRTQIYIAEIKTALEKGQEYFKETAPKIFLKHYPESEMLKENFKKLKML